MFGSKIFQFQTSVNSVRGFKPSKFSKPWIPSTFNQSNTNCTVQHTFTGYTRSHFHTARKSAAICEAKSRFDLEQLFRKNPFSLQKKSLRLDILTRIGALFRHYSPSGKLQSSQRSIPRLRAALPVLAAKTTTPSKTECSNICTNFMTAHKPHNSLLDFRTLQKKIA